MQEGRRNDREDSGEDVVNTKKESLPFDNPKLHKWFGTINESDLSNGSLSQSGTTVNNNYMTEKSKNDEKIRFQSCDYGIIGKKKEPSIGFPLIGSNCRWGKPTWIYKKDNIFWRGSQD